MAATGEKKISGLFVHELALNESTEVGESTRIWAFAHVMEGAVIGFGCNIGESCFIEAGATIGNNVTVKNGVQIWDRVRIDDEVFIGPNATFTNDMNPRAVIKKDRDQLLPTIIRRGATIGANATILPGITIGEHAFIAAGSVVTRDVPSHALMMGNPARQHGQMCVCGAKLQEGACGQCGAIVSVADLDNGRV